MNQHVCKLVQLLWTCMFDNKTLLIPLWNNTVSNKFEFRLISHTLMIPKQLTYSMIHKLKHSALALSFWLRGISCLAQRHRALPWHGGSGSNFLTRTFSILPSNILWSTGHLCSCGTPLWTTGRLDWNSLELCQSKLRYRGLLQTCKCYEWSDPGYRWPTCI